MGSEDRRTQGIGRTVRLIADLLMGTRHTRRSAARLIDVKEPAAGRQLEAIEEHLPMVTSEATPQGRAYFVSKPTEAENPVSIGTAISACFGASLAPLFEGTTYGPEMLRATRSVVDRATRASDFRDIDRKFLFHPRGGEIALRGENEHFGDLIEAVLVCRWVRLTYRRFSGKVETVEVRPMSVLVYEHQLYILGLDHADRVHPYRLSRMEHVDVTSTPFVYPVRSAYDPKQIFRDSFGIFLGDDFAVVDVAVKLVPRWVAYVETHCWHPSQTHELVDDGVIVRLRVRECPELERWILSFGEDAEVMAPTGLRERIAARLESATARYRIER